MVSLRLALVFAALALVSGFGVGVGAPRSLARCLGCCSVIGTHHQRRARKYKGRFAPCSGTKSLLGRLPASAWRRHRRMMRRTRTSRTDWTGFLRQGIFGNASHVNDVVINHLGDGRLLRTDGIHLGRDAQVRGGTIGSGASRCKADIRYTMDHPGASLA